MTCASSFPLGSCVGGIPIRMHWTCVLLFALQVGTAFMISSNLFVIALLAVLYGPVILLTILVHEYGHAFMNRKLGGSVESILIWPLGGLVYLGPTIGPVMNDFWISVAGPLTHIPQVAVWWGVWLASGGGTWDRSLDVDSLSSPAGFFHQLSTQAIVLNIILFVFNLFVPAYPLDGGHCLAALLVNAGLSVRRTAQTVAVVSVLLALLMGAYAVYDFVTGGSSILIFLVAFFLCQTSWELFKKSTDENKDAIYSHPLFQRPCYRERDEAANNGAYGLSNTV